MISREKTSIRKYKKRETLSLSISLPAQRILLKIWEMFSNAINNTLLKNKNFRWWSRKNWSFLNGMTRYRFNFSSWEIQKWNSKLDLRLEKSWCWKSLSWKPFRFLYASFFSPSLPFLSITKYRSKCLLVIGGSTSFTFFPLLYTDRGIVRGSTHPNSFNLSQYIFFSSGIKPWANLHSLKLLLVSLVIFEKNVVFVCYGCKAWWVTTSGKQKKKRLFMAPLHAATRRYRGWLDSYL